MTTIELGYDSNEETDAWFKMFERAKNTAATTQEEQHTTTTPTLNRVPSTPAVPSTHSPPPHAHAHPVPQSPHSPVPVSASAPLPPSSPSSSHLSDRPEGEFDLSIWEGAVVTHAYLRAKVLLGRTIE